MPDDRPIRDAEDSNGGPVVQPPHERRKEPRYVPSERRAFLGWWSADMFQTIPARTENISWHGAALMADYFPADVKTAWVCPIGPCSPDWFPARVLSVVKTGAFATLVRLELTEEFRYDVFSAVVWGTPGDCAPDDAGREARPPLLPPSKPPEPDHG